MPIGAADDISHVWCLHWGTQLNAEVHIFYIVEPLLKGHPSTKDNKDIYIVPESQVSCYSSLTRGHLTIKDKIYYPIGVCLIGLPP